MDDIQSWIQNVNACQTLDQLNAIRIAWKKVGASYKILEWHDYWEAVNDKLLEFEGVDKNKPAF